MTRYMRAFVLALTLSAALQAEVYLGIRPLDTLTELRERFPGAHFEPTTPAWAQPHDVIYTISGIGLSGRVIVKFFDERLVLERQLETATDHEQIAALKERIRAMGGDGSVEWVRWVPVAPIPVARFLTKYGPPENSGFADDDMQPFKYWKRGIRAFLADDAKSVVRVDVEFTTAELREAYKRRHGFVPTFLQGRGQRQ